MYASKNGYKWKKQPPKLIRCLTANIVKHKARLTPHSENLKNKSECFKLFVDDEMVDLIVQFTNQKDESFYCEWNSKYLENHRHWVPTNKNEMYAFISLLIIARALKANRKPVSYLYCRKPLYTRPIFPATMSRDRMKEVLSFLRFDDALTYRTKKGQ